MANNKKDERVIQRGLILTAHSDKHIEPSKVREIISSLENEGLELGCVHDGSLTIAMITPEGTAYSENRLRSIKRNLIALGLEEVEVERTVVVNRDHLRALSQRKVSHVSQ